jgi:hypothetical protein
MVSREGKFGKPASTPLTGSLETNVAKFAARSRSARERAILLGAAALSYSGSLPIGQLSGTSAAVLSRCNCHARNGYSHRFGGERDVVHTLTPEAMAAKPNQRRRHRQDAHLFSPEPRRLPMGFLGCLSAVGLVYQLMGARDAQRLIKLQAPLSKNLGYEPLFEADADGNVTFGGTGCGWAGMAQFAQSPGRRQKQTLRRMSGRRPTLCTMKSLYLMRHAKSSNAPC